MSQNIETLPFLIRMQTARTVNNLVSSSKPLNNFYVKSNDYYYLIRIRQHMGYGVRGAP